MKKLLLTIGTVAAIAAPVASVVACGQTKDTAKTTTAPIKASVLEGNAVLKGLGAKDGTFTSDLNQATKTGSLTLTFTVAKDGQIDGKDVKANTKVTVLITLKNGKQTFEINDATIQVPANTMDADGIMPIAFTLAQAGNTGSGTQGSGQSTSNVLTSTKSLKDMTTASSTGGYKTVAEVAKAFGITLPSGVDGTQKIDSIDFDSIDPADITLKIDFPAISGDQPLSFVLTPKK